MASFMLALISVKKFRSFQEPKKDRRAGKENYYYPYYTRLALQEKHDNRSVAGPNNNNNTERLGAGPGVAGSVAESRESGGRLQSRFGGPEAKKGRWKTLDLSATLINSWPSSVEGFFPCLAYPWGGLPLGAPRLSY